MSNDCFSVRKRAYVRHHPMAIGAVLFFVFLAPLAQSVQRRFPDVAIFNGGPMWGEMMRGNVCRHTCILERPSPQSIGSTVCYDSTKLSLRSEFSLQGALNSHAQWSLNSGGSGNQVVAFDNTRRTQAVWVLSQRGCLDSGSGRGYPSSTYFKNLSFSSGNPGLLGDFDFAKSEGSVYRGCVESTTPWKQFIHLHSAHDNGTYLQPSAKRYMRLHQEGFGTRIVPYKPTYSRQDLEVAFQRALDEVKSQEPSISRGQVIVKRGKPVIVYGFPFKDTGLTLITDERILSMTPLRILTEDLQTRAWLRLQGTALSHDDDPLTERLLPEPMKTSDLLTYSLLLIASSIVFVLELISIANACREQVSTWEIPKPGQYWTFVSESPLQGALLQHFKAPVTRHDLYLTVFSFIGAIGGIVCGFFAFKDSNVPHQDFLVVKQGIVVTYGPSNPATWAIGRGKSNQNAGAEFVVGQWLKATFAPVGYRGAFEVIVAFYFFVGLTLIFSWYKFFVQRENQLVTSWHIKPLQFCRAVIQAGLGGLARVPLVGFPINSYLREYKRTARALANIFKLEEFEPRMGFNCWWDGSLSLTSGQDVFLSPVGEPAEKAAALLAGIQFGRLTYPQVFAFLANRELVQASDEFRLTNSPLSYERVVLLSRVFSIKGVLVPEQAGRFTREELTIFDVDAPMNEVQLSKHKMSAVLLALPEGAGGEEYGLMQFAIVGSSNSSL